MIVESGAGTAALLVSLPREALGPLDTKLGSSRLLWQGNDPKMNAALQQETRLAIPRLS
jgi:hypothetical protein